MKEKIIKVISIMMMVGFCNTTVFAAETKAVEGEMNELESIYEFAEEDTQQIQSNEIIQPRVHEVCGGLSYHKLIAHGWGIVYKNGTIVLDFCPTWQCSNCGLVMVTEGDIYFGSMSTIGNYAILHNQEPLNGIVTYIYEADYYGYTSSNSLDGYKFFLNH